VGFWLRFSFPCSSDKARRRFRDAAELSVEQLLAVRDDDGPMTPQNLLGGTEGGQSLQAGILEGLETVEGNVQKILVLGGTQEPTTW